MKRPLLISCSIGAVLAIAALTLTTCTVLTTRTVERKDSFSSDFSASIFFSARSRNGSVSIERGDGMELSIVATIRARNEERLQATQLVVRQFEDGLCDASVVWPDGTRLRGEGADLQLRVPGAAEVRLETTNGDIQVDGLIAFVTARSTNGSIRVTGPAQQVDATSTNGTIDLQGIVGPIRVRSTNGKFTIALDPDNPGPVHLTTTNGGGTLGVGPAFSGLLSVRTSNGRITLDGFEADELPDTVKKGGRTKRFDFGPADHGSTLRTTNGPISIRPIRR